MCQSKRFWLVLLVAVLLAAACAPAAAPTPTKAPPPTPAPAKPAAPTPSAAERLLEAAKKEGKVVWYTSLELSIAEALAKAFQQKYGLPAEVMRSGSEKVFERFMKEAGAGIKTADIIHTSDESHFVELKKKGLLLAYRPEGAEKFVAKFKEKLQDKDNYYFVLRASPYTIGYNSKLIPAQEAPKSWKDVLDAKWRGKLVHAHPSYSGAVVTGMTALVGKFGWDYYRQLAKNEPMIVQSAVDPPKFVVSGERPVAANGLEYTFYLQKIQGHPVEIVYPAEGVPLVLSPNSIVKDAPHPNAAKLFVEFLFSNEGQQLLIDKGGLHVPSGDVTYQKDRKSLQDLSPLFVDAEEMEKGRQKLQDTFSEIFGV